MLCIFDILKGKRKEDTHEKTVKTLSPLHIFEGFLDFARLCKAWGNNIQKKTKKN